MAILVPNKMVAICGNHIISRIVYGATPTQAHGLLSAPDAIMSAVQSDCRISNHYRFQWF